MKQKLEKNKNISLQNFQKLHKDISVIDKIIFNDNLNVPEILGSFKNFLYFETKLDDIIESSNKNISFDINEYNNIKDYFKLVSYLYIYQYINDFNLDKDTFSYEDLKSIDKFKKITEYFEQNNLKIFLKEIILGINDGKLLNIVDKKVKNHIHRFYINQYLAGSLDIENFSSFVHIINNITDIKFKNFQGETYRIWQFQNKEEYLKCLNYGIKIKEGQELISVSKSLDGIEKVKDFTLKKRYKYYIITKHEVKEGDCIIDIEEFCKENIKESRYINEKEVLLKVNEFDFIGKENIIMNGEYQ